MRRSFSSMSTSLDTSSRNGVTSMEAKLVWRRCWESKATSAPAGARPLGGQQAVGVAAVHDEGGRQDPGLLAGRHLVDLDVKPPLGPALVHPQHHLGPVLRVGAAGAGVHLAHGVALVVLTGEQAAARARPAAHPHVDRLDQFRLQCDVWSRPPPPTPPSAPATPGRPPARPATPPTGRDRRATRPSSLVILARAVGIVPQVGVAPPRSPVRPGGSPTCPAPDTARPRPAAPPAPRARR